MKAPTTVDSAFWDTSSEITSGNDRGVAVDMELVHAAISAVDEEQKRLAVRTAEMTDGAVASTTQRDALLRYVLEEHGVVMDNLRGATVTRMLEDESLSPELRALLRVRWPLHLLRGALGIAMMASFVYALRTLPLSTAYSIFFVAPLLITALSVPILRERVGPRRCTAIAVGLLGVLVVLRPTGEGMLTLAGLAVLLAAFGYAVSAITVRVLSRTDSTCGASPTDASGVKSLTGS